MTLRRKTFRWPLALAGALLSFSCGTPDSDTAGESPSSSSHVEAVSIPMRDGVILKATVSLPKGQGPFPVILTRTPYGRGQDNPEFLSEGYGVISEDVRGRGDSQGKWEPFLNEKDDGYDTIEWIAKQSWCDGNVGMIGASYVGFVQWAAAAAHPPHLKCIVPIVSPPDPYQNLPYENGCFLLAVALWYSGIIGNSKSAAPVVRAGTRKPLDEYMVWPIKNADIVGKHARIDIFQKWLQMESPEDWRRADTVQDAASANIPSLSISGWFDGDQIGTQLRWASSKLKERWLVYGPWGHTLGFGSDSGDIKVEPKQGPDLNKLERDFFRRFLRHDASALPDTPRVQAYALGASQWLSGDQWPLPGAAPQKLYLDTNQRLVAQLPAAGQGTYEMDPKHVHAFPALYADPLSDTVPRTLHERDLPYGHLLYQTMPFLTPTIVTGPMSVHVAFSVDTPDADFFFLPLDVAPGGSFLPIGQGGKFRARKYLHLTGLGPNHIYEADLPLWESLYQVPSGHRLGLMISSDRFPVYSINSNTAEPLANVVKTIKTHPKIYYGPSSAVKPSSFSFSTLNR